MDKYYGNVCELDIIFSFTKAYYILDEILLAGELQESSKKNILRCISQQDSLEDMEVRIQKRFLRVYFVSSPFEHQLPTSAVTACMLRCLGPPTPCGVTIWMSSLGTDICLR